MSRSGYTDDMDDTLAYGRWRAQVASAIRGGRGQKFLKELADAMDAMPEKILITEELVDHLGDCCAIGVICKSRGLDVHAIDECSPEDVGSAVGIASQLAAEIAFENDEAGFPDETPEQRWVRMRGWVSARLREETTS